MIDLSQASFIGPKPNDREAFTKLPAELRDLLFSVNGFVLFGGGLHVRGVCDAPVWHSLGRVWHGADALGQLYASLHPDDIPFAQDCLGDQLLLRDGLVIRLFGETGEINETGIGLTEFLESAQEDPDEFLSLPILRRFEREGGTLAPGELLSVYPPLCTQEASDGISLRAIPTMERIKFLADFAHQIAAVPDGTKVRVIVR